MRVLTVVAILLTSACNQGAREVDELIEPGRASEEARSAVAQNDLRLLGVAGYAVELPGVPLSFDDAERLYGVRVIERTGDVYQDGVSARRNEQAKQYATIYNKTILLEVPPQNKAMQ